MGWPIEKGMKECTNKKLEAVRKGENDGAVGGGVSAHAYARYDSMPVGDPSSKLSQSGRYLSRQYHL